MTQRLILRWLTFLHGEEGSPKSGLIADRFRYSGLIREIPGRDEGRVHLQIVTVPRVRLRPVDGLRHYSPVQPVFPLSEF